MTTRPQPFVLELLPNTPTTPMPPTYGELEFGNPDVDNHRFLYNVTVPTLTVCLPDPAVNTGTSMIVCPGGGMYTLAIDYEGYDVAEWLCERGIAAFVLKYRLMTGPLEKDAFLEHFRAALSDLPTLEVLAQRCIPMVLEDGQHALNLVRERAGEWGLKADRVGMMGFSAGAFVTVMNTLHAEPGQRPDCVGAIYGALWGTLEVSGTMPPVFIAVASDDPLAVIPSLDLYRAWHSTGNSVEMHMYAGGGHGFGMRKINPATDAWIQRMLEWMQEQGLV